jgi:hypothetical protein
MLPNGTGDFQCDQSDPDTGMKARFSTNSNGKNWRWRCYAVFTQNNNENACVDNNGELTSEGQCFNLFFT